MGRTRASAGEPLGREQIVDAAMRVTKVVGLEGLTMRKLAAELGVTPMAMYHHVPNKDVLMQFVADAVIADVAIPPATTGPWDARLAQLTRELRARLAEFPGVGPYFLGSDIPTPGADRIVTAAIAMLVEEGFEERDAALAFTAVHNYLLGRLYVEASLRGPRVRRLRAKRAGQPQPPGTNLPADEYFEFALRHLLDGLHSLRHPVVTLHDVRIDVSDAVDLPGRHHTAVGVALPSVHTEPVVVAFGFPGGGYNRHYFDLDPELDLPGPGGNSEARWHAARGWVFVACDHLGVGGSSRPEPAALTLETLAAANDATVRAVVARIEAGELVDGFPARRVACRLGFGQSMGGCLTIVAQGQRATFDGIGILGYSAVHTVMPTPSGVPSGQLDLTRGTPVRDLAASTAAIGEDTFGYAFHWDDVPRAITEADLDQYPLRDHAGVPRWGAGSTPPPAAATMLSAGAVAAEAAAVEVPVLVAVGERDVVPEPRAEPVAYRSSSDISVFIASRMAHMHNFAGTRERFWSRIHSWGDHIAGRLPSSTEVA